MHFLKNSLCRLSATRNVSPDPPGRKDIMYLAATSEKQAAPEKPTAPLPHQASFAHRFWRQLELFTKLIVVDNGFLEFVLH